MGYLHQLRALRGFVRSQANLQQAYRRLTVAELESRATQSPPVPPVVLD
jgi:hypothetical protein